MCGLQIDKVLAVRYSDDWARENLDPTGDSDTDGVLRPALRAVLSSKTCWRLCMCAPALGLTHP